MFLFPQGSGNLPDEPAHIKEQLSRIIVEIAKREWPQKWDSLLPDLNSICGLGVRSIYQLFLKSEWALSQ